MIDGGCNKADVLVVFALDNTLVDVDSTVYISQVLDTEVANSVWTNDTADRHDDCVQLMNAFFGQLTTKCPQVSSTDIRNAIECLPCCPSMITAISFALDDFGASCVLGSDAIVMSVHSFLQRHPLAHQVDEVIANPTHFEKRGKMLRVRPYVGEHVAPHGCPNCPSNLCKGAILDRIVQHHRYSRVFARAGQVGRKLYELLPLLRNNPDQVQAHIRQRKTGNDILGYFRHFLYQQYPQCNDTLVHADDGNLGSIPTPMSRSHGDLLAIFYFGDSRALVKEESVWPSMFDEMLQALAEERPAMTPEQICERVAQIPIQTRMIDAIRMAAELFSADVKVIIDGNTFCIESLMHRSELSQHVKKVFANPVEYETLSDGRTRLRIQLHHADYLKPHECAWCPSNMCKGSIVDSIRSTKPYSRVIYDGDGTGDICPASRLSKNDVVLARSHLLNGEPYGMQRQINTNPGVAQLLSSLGAQATTFIAVL